MTPLPSAKSTTKDFLSLYSSDLVYAGVTAIAEMLLLYGSNKLFGWSTKTLPDQVYPKNGKALRVMKRILQIVLILLGAMQMVFLFADKGRTD